MTAGASVHPSWAESLRIVVVTDRRIAHPESVFDVVVQALAAGARAVQLRDKDAPPRDAYPLARRLRRATLEHDALLFVNDRVDLALAAGADGAHLGPDDLPVRIARKLVPPGFLLGYSTSCPSEARSAADEGADYIGCGPVFETNTKRDAGPAIGLAGLAAVVRAATVPVVGIGGITPTRAAAVRATGAAGSAVVGALMAAPDPSVVARRFASVP